MGPALARHDLERTLACPDCRGALEEEPRAFLCRGCGARWPIVRGIPRFVASEQYVGSFGYEWRRHRATQLDSRKSRESEETFAAKTGLRPEDVSGKRVLDVGVGAGRFADVVARWGGTPTGVDLSLAVRAARRNLARYEGARVLQADLFRLPFHGESFDIVYSIGVLHHTPSTRDALRAIAPLVRPGGILAAAVYDDVPHEWYRHADRHRRWTTAMSHSLLHLLSHVAIGKQHVHEALRAGLGRFGPYAAGQAQWALPTREHQDPRWRVLDTFDWYSPRYQWRHEEREVRRWFEELGFEEVSRTSDRTMICVRGRRPAAGSLRVPPPSSEAREGALAALPGWVPPPGMLRDLVLAAALTGSVARSALEVTAGAAALVVRKARGLSR